MVAPKLRGIYILLILVKENTSVEVGSLGEILFERGSYAYVGSAQNNLEKRVKRHLRKSKKKFWHIDYLLENEQTEILEVYYKEAKKSEECRVAKEIEKVGQPVSGFGASDCNCVSHLFKLNNLGIFRKIVRREMMRLFINDYDSCNF